MDFYNYSQERLQALGDGLVGRIALIAKGGIVRSRGTPLGELLDEGRIVSVHRERSGGPITSVCIVALDDTGAAPREWPLLAILGLVEDEAP